MYLANQSRGIKFTYDHFKAENIPRDTITKTIKRAENDAGHQRVVGSGHIAKKMT